MIVHSVRRFLLRFVSLFRSGRAEADLEREIAAHLQLLEDRFIEQGMSARDARYAARRAFGGVEQAKEHQRESRTFRPLAGWPMDLRLGGRMLVKSPGLTIVAVVALSVAIGAGAAYLEFVNDLVRPTLPIENGDRIVGIVNWGAHGRPEHRSLHDFEVWREELRSVVDLGAAAALEANLITDDGRAEPVSGVAISASAFRLVPTAPLLGRALVDADEHPAAPPVVVLGHDLWKARFNGDAGIIGRQVRLDNAWHTVIGVMPARFGFPVNESLWAPLGRETTAHAPGQGPAIRIFGRLAPDVQLETAQAELTALATREMAATPPEQQRRPVIASYVASLWSGVEDGELQKLILYSFNLVFLGLLGICGANVATLVFARTATREGEITVRTALGASRGRIVAQLFAESLILSALATVVGLLVAAWGQRWANATWSKVQGSAPPFWWNDDLSIETLLYSAVLAVLAAAIVGIIPALKATGPQMQARLNQAASRGSSMKFGGVWTGVIVAQVGVTVVFLLSVVSLGWNLYASRYGTSEFRFAREQFLSVRLEMDRGLASSAGMEAAQAEFRARFQRTSRELERRLESEPAVAGVTFATRLPGSTHGEFFVELQGAAPPPGAPTPLWVRTTSVAPDFFDTLGAPIVAGRAFSPADAALDRNVVIVDETFVQRILGGRDAIGVQVRQPQNSENPSPGPWYEIVGVVRDLSSAPQKATDEAVLYRPAAAGVASPLHMVVHVRGEAKSFAPMLRTLAAETDSTLRLYDLMPMHEVDWADRMAQAFLLRFLAIVGAVALLLSTAGVYALMSFTLARRTREIGIRAALGAAPRRIVTAIFSKAFLQVGLGVVLGSVPGAILMEMGVPQVDGTNPAAVVTIAVVSVAAFILAVTLLAGLAPARRALRIQPTEALRAE